MVYGVSNPIRFNIVGEVIGLEPMECELLTNLKRKKKEGLWYLFRNDSSTKKDLCKDFNISRGLVKMLTINKELGSLHSYVRFVWLSTKSFFIHWCKISA